MSNYKIIDKGNQPHFLTLTLVGHVPIFTYGTIYQIVLDNFQHYRESAGLKIYAFVLMDNHIHLIASAPDLPLVLQSMKGYMAKQIIKILETDQRFWIIQLLESLKKNYKKKSRYQVWEEDNHPKLIQGVEMLNQKIEYIHQNPVKRGLVRIAEDWMYSSASNYLGLDSVFDIDMLEVF